MDDQQRPSGSGVLQQAAIFNERKEGNLDDSSAMTSTTKNLPAGEALKSNDAKSDASSESDYDDMLTCLVCDRAFTTARQLFHHQKQKKHFLCSICDSTFANVEQLKEHKERENHWSDIEDGDEDKMEDENGVQSDSSSEGGDMSQTFSEIERLL